MYEFRLLVGEQREQRSNGSKGAKGANSLGEGIYGGFDHGSVKEL